MFGDLFRQATGGSEPYPYQQRLATEPLFPELLSIPTGLGKTAAVILAWLWRRRFGGASIRAATPRRLIYCLPMRVLVEQTFRDATRWLDNLGLLAESPGDPNLADTSGWKAWSASNDADTARIAVSLLMGGESPSDWALWPEHDAFLIGTQDMVLSRSLNRGYAANSSRWPIEFGLLHSDALWVFDEVQLFGCGLATTAQLDAFAKKLWKPAKPRQCLWMSATIGDSFLQTRDRRDWGLPNPTPLELSPDDLTQPSVQLRIQASKTLQIVKDRPNATRILESHRRGRISLLTLNTVPVARSAYAEIRAEIRKPVAKNKPHVPQPEICLLHGRFRPLEREQHMNRLLAFIEKMDETGAVPDSDGFIVVSTQVVEAGFDLSSARLWSEIAPWPSVVQRLGRLNRDGLQPEASASFWLPKADEGNKSEANPNAKRVGPYEKKSLDAARKLVEAVIANQSRGLSYRNALDLVLATDESKETLVVEPEVVIRPDDFFELFSTEPDLAGGFTNVSQFVRNQDRNADVLVFWRDFNPKKVNRPDEFAPSREELCAVPVYEFRQFIKAHVAWEWNFEIGQWETRRATDIQPGMTLLLPKLAGGYSDELGWTGVAKDHEFRVLAGTSDDDSLNVDFLRGDQNWVSLADHSADVEAEMGEILQSLDLREVACGKCLLIAARWHDWGKSLEKWQAAVQQFVEEACLNFDKVIQSGTIPQFNEVASEWRDRMGPKGGFNVLWAKFPDPRAACLDSRLSIANPAWDDNARRKLSRMLKVQFRPNLRHEAGSALAAWQSWLQNNNELTALTLYLIACHHGKVRTVLRSTSRAGGDTFGIRDGMTLQSIAGVFANPTELSTNSKFAGAFGNWDADDSGFTITSPSWLQMVAELLGPKRDDKPPTYEVISESEPRGLGPLTLAYFEALLRAADARASQHPGKGAKS